MKVYTARQAIFNRKKHVVAYELLFRDGLSNAFPNIESNQATAKLLLDSQFNQGIKVITSGKKALINFPEKALLDLLPSLLPPDQVIIEILEDVRPTEQVYEACKTLFHKGYKLALDDFVYSKPWLPFIKICRLIKIDIMETPLDTVAPLIEKLKQYKSLKLLAEKVETNDEFLQAKAMGFDYYQGYFFCKPEIIEQKDVDNSQAAILALYNEVLRKNMNYEKLASHFEHDTALSYKLLRFINSGLFSVKEEIGSLRQALVYLGEERVKKFVCMIITAHLAQSKPSELTELSIVRARFCELIAIKVSPGMSNNAFILGLFSLIDAILDKPMEDILLTLPISDNIKDALLGKNNILLNILEVEKAYEKASWWAMKKACEKLNLDEDSLAKYYTESISWANSYKTS
ncbi:EAL and HDOD domain-containing protein [Pseudoalteromonas denitrificans]|uniref:EAL and modified HD-GYP domain-containing signal transduction protein n=1 Tax=Pseudoalteromonas denitrificans DSM 6059 TaxID=1123010 RepID=A0A1I1RMT7_9GAMM|nr:HDOD domain-containing protein [Pseudoalteromonas denitrificans]SFD32963.1 EAL and modified HD-GYP domain-containing signal transduction protein [Pseudoalteromonas denitrificans DSM 6059]